MYNNNTKNTVILGAAIVFILIFWSYQEFIKSYELIESAKDPIASIERGKSDATNDFNNGDVRFKQFKSDIPGIKKSELESEFKVYAPYTGLWCGFESYIEDIGLKLSGYEYNFYYVHSYNIELRSLIDVAER